jgi:hypothetical protein
MLPNMPDNGPVLATTPILSLCIKPIGQTNGMTLTTRLLVPETWDDFTALVESGNGVWRVAPA